MSYTIDVPLVETARDKKKEEEDERVNNSLAPGQIYRIGTGEQSKLYIIEHMDVQNIEQRGMRLVVYRNMETSAVLARPMSEFTTEHNDQKKNAVFKMVYASLSKTNPYN
jgi:hypothetical protein